MAYLTGYQYYENSGNIPEDANWGSYQYVSLADIVNNFLVAYVGDGKIIDHATKQDILFHSKRAIQEFSYDV